MLAAFSLSWLFIAGLGALPAFLLSRRPRQGDDYLYLLAAAWGFGLSLNYAFLFEYGRLAVVLIVGALIALCQGLATLSRWRSVFARPARWRSWFFAAAVLIIGTIAIVLDPLQDWDARSIWFFHAKMIFYGGGLVPEMGLTSGQLFHHPDYPMLVPGLAAEVARIVGFWNEYLPKLSLALLLPVPILAVMTLRRTPLSMALAILAFSMIPNKFLYNGSMDGYLALYSASAVLFLAAWIENKSDAAFLAAMGTLGVVLGIKVEGQVVALAIILALGFLLAIRRFSLPRPSWPALLLAPLPFIGFLAWHMMIVTWALPSEGFSLKYFWPRLGDPAALWQLISWTLLLGRVAIPSLIVVAILVLARQQKMPAPAAAWLPLLAGVIYLGASGLLFAMTGADLVWQLATAASRVTQSGTEMIVIGGLLVLQRLERVGASSPVGRLSALAMRWTT